MEPMAMFAVSVLAVSVFLLSWAVFAGPGRARQRTVLNLSRGMYPEYHAVEAVVPEDEETGGTLATIARKFTPAPSVRMLEKLLIKAGRPQGWPLEKLLVAKLVLGIGVALLSVAFVSSTTGALPLLMAVARFSR